MDHESKQQMKQIHHIQIEPNFPKEIEDSLERPTPAILGSAKLSNELDLPIEGLVMEILSEPAFFEPELLPVQPLPAQSTQLLSEIALELKSEFFQKLAEPCVAQIFLRVKKEDEILAEESLEITLIPPPPRLSLIYDRSINYAFQQNAIPVVKELRLQNNGVARKNLVFRVTTEPAFAPSAEIRLQSIEPGGEFRISPLDLKLSHDFLAELNEKVAGWLKVEMLEGGEVVQTITEPITLLAKNEWCGLVALPEILAAFVLPNDPAVMKILSRAADLLKEATGRADMNGYQDKSRKRAWEQIAAIYKAVGEQGIRYINPPPSFENTGQKVRFPSEIVNQRFGTCLDLSLLFAACCEYSGLRPFVFIHDGHAYAGCWLEERSMPEPASDDLRYFRMALPDDLITVFETTTVTSDHPGTLDDAELLARPHLQTEKPFRLALDIHASRSARISPLPVPGQIQISPSSPVNGTNTTQAGTLGSRDIVEGITISDPAAAKPTNRIDLWKSRLLDLSLRNRLLNFRETNSTIRILSEPEHVEDQLAAERELSVRAKPKLMSEEDPRNATTFTKEQRADALRDHLRDELRVGRLHTHLEENEHARRLTELYRSARNALDENGTNTLFAAVGILEWRETKHSDRVHRAPLLLVPVELKRKSVLEGFSLRRIDEETRLNVTLMEMLRQNFKKEIAGLEPLPEDQNGVNVDHVFRIFREAVRDLPGWEVKAEVWLAQFSFTKFLLWKDLSDRLEHLSKNRIVNHLVHQAGTPIQNPSKEILPEELDERFHPRDLLCPRSADSSQLAAVMAAANGQDFVLEGPPGTGKSQTITNIIAHCLVVGKRVLFVAEKRAALDVVHRRLREDGLEPFCLELHSNKTGKTDVLAQFDKSLKFAEESETGDWEYRAAELERLRSELNSYSQTLHRRLPCGLSAYQCLDYLLARQDAPFVRMNGWSSILETTQENLEQARRVARLMMQRTRPLLPLGDHNLAPLACESWSPPWAERCLDLNSDFAEKIQITIETTRELLKWMQLGRVLAREELQRLDELLELFLSPQPVGPAFVTTPWTQLSEDLELWTSLIDERNLLRTSLAPLHVVCQTGPTASCESLSEESSGILLQKGRNLQTLLKSASAATSNLLHWLGAPEQRVSRDQMMHLTSLAECLLETDEVGAGFATTPWETWSPSFDLWISLVRERSEIRSGLSGYDETKLLALDLDLLQEKWSRAQSAWFLPKLVNLSSVRSHLRKALPAKVKPDDSRMGEVISLAIRLRAINQDLASIYTTAEALLGKSWNQGEPDSTQMERIRNWGQSLHRQLSHVAGANRDWLTSMQNLLVGYFQIGPAAFSTGTTEGDLLFAMSHSFKAFDAACMDFTTTGALNRTLLDGAVDYPNEVENMLKTYLSAVPRIREINATLSAATTTANACLGAIWLRGEPHAAAIRNAKAWGETLHSRLLAFAGDDFAWLGGFRQMLSGILMEGPAAFSHSTTIGSRMHRFRSDWHAFNETLERYRQELSLRPEVLEQVSDYLVEAHSLTERVASSWPKIKEWCFWQKARHEAIQLGLNPVVEKLESPEGASVDVAELFEVSFRRGLLFSIIEREAPLRDFFGNEHNERIEQFRKLDERLAKLSRDLIRARLAGGIPRDEGSDDIPKAEIGTLRKEISKKSRHMPVRQLIGRIPTLLPRLKPCVLMSPLSVAQYLEASHETFDVVIFDEASQIPVWDAIGAIARGSQLIVVGDPKQLPPTNFFATNNHDEDDLTPEEHKDLESILDELMTHGLRQKRLKWHYRSRHEGLITFSNRQYYDNDLLTFPSPEMELGGVRFRYLADARYDKGKSRTNLVEAQTLVEELVSRLRNPTLPRRSYGVVTFSQAQQALVENLLDEERRKYPEIESHFGDEPPVEGEPVFVKNLESVQGDERDVIFFSICYGLDEAGKLSMNFGPLNRDGGERRLNVAVTRAKHEVMVFTGLRGDQIDLTRTRARGVRDLKFFLDYAERGPRALTAATNSSANAEADSEFERMVADRIRAAGYDVHYQVGCSGYRVDLGIVDPSAPGRYLLGVECDGATYHRAATARDRDKLRQAVLEDLGWTLHRVWSTDWWHNPDAEMEKLLAAISTAAEAREPDLPASAIQFEDGKALVAAANFSTASAVTSSHYNLTDFSTFADRISADRFHADDYEATLREMIGNVIETEGPILDGLLVNRVARAHDLQRSGRRINEKVMQIAKRDFHVKSDPVGGSFVWQNSEAAASYSCYRTSISEENVRKIEEIPFEEIRVAYSVNPKKNSPVEIARMLGIRRLTSPGRNRIEAVIRLCSFQEGVVNR